MKASVRIQSSHIDRIRADLDRRHFHAWERVGFIAAGAIHSEGRLQLLVRDYMPVADEDYVPSSSVGAEIGSEAFRKALQWAYASRSALLHVHTHHGRGRPAFSGVDLTSGCEFVPSFFITLPRMPHGMLVLSNDSAAGLLWYDEHRDPLEIDEFTQVGAHYRRDWRAA